MVELEKTVEPTWPKLVEPLEKIVDRVQVVWGIVNHLKAVKDSPELRAAIEEVQVVFLSLEGYEFHVYGYRYKKFFLYGFLFLCFVQM